MGNKNCIYGETEYLRKYIAIKCFNCLDCWNRRPDRRLIWVTACGWALPCVAGQTNALCAETVREALASSSLYLSSTILSSGLH